MFISSISVLLLIVSWCVLSEHPSLDYVESVQLKLAPIENNKTRRRLCFFVQAYREPKK